MMARVWGARADGSPLRRVEKTVGKFLIPHNLLEFIFGEQAEWRGWAVESGARGERRGGSREGGETGNPGVIGSLVETSTFNWEFETTSHSSSLKPRDRRRLCIFPAPGMLVETTLARAAA